MPDGYWMPSKKTPSNMPVDFRFTFGRLGYELGCDDGHSHEDSLREYALRRLAEQNGGDVFVFRDQGPAFQIEVGGANKRVDAEIAEMRARLLPGFQPLVILYRDGAVRSADVTYYLSRACKFTTIDALIEGAGANA